MLGRSPERLMNWMALRKVAVWKHPKNNEPHHNSVFFSPEKMGNIYIIYPCQLVSPKWLYSIGSHQETHVFLFDFTTTLEILWSFFKQRHENQLWQDAEIVFLPQKLHVSNFYQAIYHKFFCQKGRWTIPIPIVCYGICSPSFACHHRLCMEPIHQSFRKLRQEMEAAGPQKASPIPVWGGEVENSQLGEGEKKTHVWTNWGWIRRLFIFFLFFFLNHVCLSAKWEFCCFFPLQTRTLGSVWFKWCYMIG